MISTNVTCSQGSREYMEDFYMITKVTRHNNNLYIVFDGHGGAQVAAFCKMHFADVLTREFENTIPETDVKIRNAFLQMDALLRKHFWKESQSTGTTVGLIFFDKNKIWIANCGDTEVMVSYKNNTSNMLTQSHKVDNETDRLEKLGATITNFDCPRIDFRLNIARSLGDFELKKYVIPDPYIKSIPFTKNIDYIILASDGLWDVFSQKELTSFIDYLKNTKYAQFSQYEKSKMNQICHDIVLEALKKGSTDNITLVFILIE